MSLEKPIKYKSVASNPNNILVASMDNMSVVKLSIDSASDEAVEAHDNRYRLTVQLQFFHAVDAQSFQAQPGATRDTTDTKTACVFVNDKCHFAEFVAWKGNDTERQWDRYNAVLGNL